MPVIRYIADVLFCVVFFIGIMLFFVPETQAILQGAAMFISGLMGLIFVDISWNVARLVKIQTKLYESSKNGR